MFTSASVKVITQSRGKKGFRVHVKNDKTEFGIWEFAQSGALHCIQKPVLPSVMDSLAA